MEGLLHGGLLGSTDGEVLVTNEGIKLRSSSGKVLVIIIGNVYGITLGIDVVIELCLLDGSFDGYNVGKFEGLLLGGSLGYTDGKVLGYNKDTKLVSIHGKLVLIIIGNVDGNILGLDVGTESGSLYGCFDGSNCGNLE